MRPTLLCCNTSDRLEYHSAPRSRPCEVPTHPFLARAGSKSERKQGAVLGQGAQACRACYPALGSGYHLESRAFKIAPK
jgi:hypothetical protein